MEIKFRGKPLADLYEEFTGECIFDTEEFVYGNLICSGNERYIVGEVVEASEDYIILEWWTPVDPATVGQYTGFKDTSGVDIYEGDWAEWNEYDYSGFPGRAPERVTARGHIIFNEGSWIIASKTGARYLDMHALEDGYDGGDYGCVNKVRIIGNTHDNPELLEATP